MSGVIESEPAANDASEPKKILPVPREEILPSNQQTADEESPVTKPQRRRRTAITAGVESQVFARALLRRQAMKQGDTAEKLPAPKASSETAQTLFELANDGIEDQSFVKGSTNHRIIQGRGRFNVVKITRMPDPALDGNNKILIEEQTRRHTLFFEVRKDYMKGKPDHPDGLPKDVYFIDNVKESVTDSGIPFKTYERATHEDARRLLTKISSPKPSK